MTFFATARSVDNVLVVDLSGRMGKGEALEQLRTMIHVAIEAGNAQFAFHMAGVTYMDEAGLGELFECYASITKRKGTLHLIQAPEKVKLLLSMYCGKYLFAKYFEDEQAALASFKVADS